MASVRRDYLVLMSPPSRTERQTSIEGGNRRIGSWIAVKVDVSPNQVDERGLGCVFVARLPIFLVWALLLATGAAGCATDPDRVRDCVPPSNEDALLDEYANDAALGVAPAGATRRGEPQRLTACHRVGYAVSNTAMTVQYDLARDLGQEEVLALFDQVSTAAGWTRLDVQTSGLGGSLRYCRPVLGEPSHLDVVWQHAINPDGGRERAVPGVLTTTVYGSTNADAQRGDPRCST